MKAPLDDPVRELKAGLADPLPWRGARIGFLARFLLALFEVRSANLAELATGFGGPAQVGSPSQRPQRFRRSFESEPDSWARLLVRLVPVGAGPWRLPLERTPWTFGAVDLNFLVLGIADRGIALPVCWSVLGQAGHSHTAEGVALMERFRAGFGVERIAVPLADREFVGAAGFRWLQARPIPFPPTPQMRPARPPPLEPAPAG